MSPRRTPDHRPAHADVTVVVFLILVVRGGTVGVVRDAMVPGRELDQLLGSDESARLRWLDHRQPVPPVANWWLYVAVLTDRRDLRALERQEMIDSRRARNLLNAAERHRADLADPDLADRLHAWLAIKPRLV